MIEHNMDVALELADRITLLHFGEVIVEGTRAAVVADPRTREVVPWRLRPSALRQVDAYYGDSHALQGVSFAAGAGRLLGLVGRNGAGKTDRHERRRRPAAAARRQRGGVRQERGGFHAGSDRRAAAWRWCRKAAASFAA